ncbi:amidohydrolase family protein [Cryptosporangium sp. NPDC048952]|uniref:amidohydrolase family protein n=1 Tax=Cryptosporangium sp. NPDC048952 TaxID=3363961 RepID=UPI0037228D29
MRIDVHQHLWPPSLIDALRARVEPPRLDGWTLHTGSAPPFEVDPADHDVDARIALIEADGLDRALISLSSPLGIEWLPDAEALLDAYHAGVAALPDRFGAWAAAGLVSIDPAALEKALDAGCIGLQLPANALLDPAGYAHCAPLLEVLERRGAPLLVHPGPHPAPPAGAPAWWPALSPYIHQMHDAWHALVAFGRAAHPTLRICFALLAGLGPLHGERLVARGGPTRRQIDRNAFVDTSSYGPRAVDAIVRVLGVDLVVLGSDRPYATVPDFGFGDAFDHAMAVSNPARLIHGEVGTQ